MHCNGAALWHSAYICAFNDVSSRLPVDKEMPLEALVKRKRMTTGSGHPNSLGQINQLVNIKAVKALFLV